jgi:hypothetical protein
MQEQYNLCKKKNQRKLLKYSAVKFTISVHVNSSEFTKFHTFSRNLFFGRQTKLKIASHGLFHKKSFVIKTIHVTSSYIIGKIKDFCEKLTRGFF